MNTLSEMGEFGFIRQLRARVQSSESVAQGIGDDCAVLKLGDRLLLVSCDASLEDVHFRRGWPAHAIGYKAAASALSDIAAMGGHALWMLAAVAVPPALDSEALDELMAGVHDAATGCGAVLVGGDTTRSRMGLMLDITVLGEPHRGRCMLRSGARAGDLLAITGFPGVAAAGLHALENGLKAGTLVDRFWYPVPRLDEGRWLSERGAVHALVDVSDGIVQDAGHIGEESKVGIELQSGALPLDEVMARYGRSVSVDTASWSLTGGEDYELLAAIDPKSFDAIREEFQQRFHLPLTAVGVCTSASGAITVDGKQPVYPGYDHFRPPRSSW